MHEIPKPDKRGLRNFGLMMGGVVACLFGLLFPWLASRRFPSWPWIIAAVLWLWAFLVPQTLEIVYRNWMRIGIALGWINTRILLGIFFYFIVMPIGLVMRLSGRDPMARKFDKHLETYRVQSRNMPNKKMEVPF